MFASAEGALSWSSSSVGASSSLVGFGLAEIDSFVELGSSFGCSSLGLVFGASCSSYLVLGLGRTYPVPELVLKKDFLDFAGWERRIQES